jgi:predicted molibdopterin-dependent oxidoreductase YjgC
MSRRVRALNECFSEERLEINPADAGKFGISEGDWVRVSSRRGNVKARALVIDNNPPGVVYLNFHFGETPTNTLTGAAFDRQTCTPDFKVTAVKVEKD